MTFLTKLDRPKMWYGYPFLLSFVSAIEDNLIVDIYGKDTQGSNVGHGVRTIGAYQNKVVDIDLFQCYNSSLTDLSYFLVTIKTDLGEILIDSFRVDFAEPCANPVYLIGRNSLGGCLCWMFDVNQEYRTNFDDDKKAKRLTLYTTHLTINQWESLQDFVTLGQLYRNNITEFTSSTIKTSSKIGQQIYVVDTDAGKIGVVALNTNNTTFTKQVRHVFNLEIEYPEQF